MKGIKGIIILLSIVISIFPSGCTQNIGKNDSTDEMQAIIGYAMEGIDVPEEVLAAAKTKVMELFNMERGSFPDYNYTNWRIESLEYSYTYSVDCMNKALISDSYKDSNEMKIDIYQMNYEIFTESPEKIVFTGGMYITEGNWVMPNYPNSWYLIFENNGDESIYIDAMMENDCSPGDELFSNDLLRKLEENTTEPKIGTYRIVDDKGISTSYVKLKENNEFEFCRNTALSYLPIGSYFAVGDKLMLSVYENEIYVFTIDIDKLIFESSTVIDSVVEKGTVYILSDED